jgi:hypothetical protein
MKFNKTISILKDRLGNSYMGIKFSSYEVESLANQLNEYLGEEYELYKTNRNNRDGDKYHITFLSVPEYQPIREDAIKLLGQKVNLEVVGIGKAEGKGNITYFAIVNSTDLDTMFSKFYDTKKDYHITLGFNQKDVFGVSKGLDTLIDTKKALI